MSASDDEIVATFKARAKLTGGLQDWIVAILSELLMTCVAPSPAKVRDTIKKPVTRIRLIREFRVGGLTRQEAQKATDQVVAAILDYKDDELAKLIACGVAPIELPTSQVM